MNATERAFVGLSDLTALYFLVPLHLLFSVLLFILAIVGVITLFWAFFISVVAIMVLYLFAATYRSVMVNFLRTVDAQIIAASPARR